jgi:hypothetical protein
MFRSATGFPCPSCGMTRAWIAFFQLNFGQAFRLHPLFLLPALLIVFIGWKHYFLRDRFIIYANIFYVICGILLVGFYIYRMIVYFPDAEPMMINPDSMLFRVIALANSE